MIGPRTGAAAPFVETLAVGAVFLATGLVGIANHEMWRDELEIWLVARDSASVGELLLVNMKTAGHPAVWYLLNFVLTRFTTNPLAMQLLNLAIATAAAVLFFRRAPFPTAQRLLFCFGYYLLYEFTVISRSYALGLLLVFAFCVRFQDRKRLDITGAMILLLLANTTLYGTIVAAHVALLVVLQALFERPSRHAAPDRRTLLALSIVLVGVAVGFGHTWVQARAIGPAHADAYAPTQDLTWIGRCLATVYRGAIPLPDPTQFHTWNSNLLDALPAYLGVTIGAVLAVLLVVAAVYRLRRERALTIVFVLGSATMLFITFFVWYGSVRHHGQIFLWYLTCCWLWYGLADRGNEDDPARPTRAPNLGRAGTVLTAILLLQTAAGAHAWAKDLLHPFSSARAAGSHLRQGEFDDVTLVGSVDYAVQPIAAYLDGPFFYPESGEFRTFLDWGPERKIVTPDVVLRESLALLEASGRDVVIVFSYRPGAMEPGDTVRLGPHARMTCFARFVGALVADENYHLCRVFKAPGRPATHEIDTPIGRTDNYDRETQEER